MQGDENIGGANSAATQPGPPQVASSDCSNAHAMTAAEAGTADTAGLPKALRNNAEYMAVYRAIDALKSQLDRAKSDMEILEQLRRQATAEPLPYVKSVVANKAPKAPSQQAVVDLPSVYVEPYLTWADAEAIEAYMSSIRAYGGDRSEIHTVAGTPGRSTPAAVVLRSMPIRHSALDRRLPQSARSTGRAAQQPSAGNWARSTGHTAVGTPEQSPARPPNMPITGNTQSLPSAAASGSGSSAVASRLLDDILATTALPSQEPAQISRANTEPLQDTTGKKAHSSGEDAGSSSATRPEVPATGIRATATQPGTPTHRGKSQKTLTPQMLAEFRRQVSAERSLSPVRVGGMSSDLDYNDNDDDDFVEPNTMSVPSGQQRHAGKGLSASMQQNQKTPKPPKRGHASTPGGTQKRQQPRSKAKGTRGPSRRDDNKPKPANFNLPWSDEEQQQLEELLLVFPEEEVANDRWRKISDALGTRTMRQVASRVQKYFIKLAKAGLPVPGKVPDTSNWTSIGRGRATATTRASFGGRSGRQQGQRRSNAGGSSSAGGRKRKHVDFTSSSDNEEEEFEVDLDGASDSNENAHNYTMAYDRKGKQADRSSLPYDLTGNSSLGISADEDHGISANSVGMNGLYLSASGTGAAAYDEFHAFGGESSRSNGSGGSSSSAAAAAVPRLQEQTPALRSSKSVHLGYRCDSCLAEPIVGIRWHCLECHGAQVVDLCDECREEGTFETAWHKMSHNFQAKRDAEMEPYYANEVAATALREYSYLA
ncbi:hypothetical protein GQ54DRAFT_337398 [Martensiomyces pterosporus]|nr:hypothetical protein GQ54DRAFT_337398 [Martensiomyces pterosporus]